MSRQRLVASALLLSLLVLSVLPTLTAAQSSSEFFDEVVNGEISAPLLAGPYDYPLQQEAGVLTVFRAGLNVADFVAHAAFTNPTDTSGAGWDYGFQFRTTGNNDDLRIFVASDGTWNFSIGTDPPDQTVVAPNLDTAPGATNTLDLIVQGFTAIFGINGEYMGTIALPDLLPSGDVYASTGFFGNFAVPGRIIQLNDFTVYGVPNQGAAPTGQTGAIPPPRPVTLHTGSCDNLGDVARKLTDATYPEGEFLGQPSAVVAETSFTRIPLFLDDLLGSPYAINVAESADAPQTSIACGDIGGVLDELGGFVLSLTERNGSNVRGVAYLAAETDGDGSNISVFLVPGPEPAAAPAPTAAPEIPAAPASPIAPASPTAPLASPVATTAPAATPEPIIVVGPLATPGSVIGVELAPAATPAG